MVSLFLFNISFWSSNRWGIAAEKVVHCLAFGNSFASIFSPLDPKNWCLPPFIWKCVTIGRNWLQTHYTKPLNLGHFLSNDFLHNSQTTAQNLCWTERWIQFQFSMLFYRSLQFCHIWVSSYSGLNSELLKLVALRSMSQCSRPNGRPLDSRPLSSL